MKTTKLHQQMRTSDDKNSCGFISLEFLRFIPSTEMAMRQNRSTREATRWETGRTSGEERKDETARRGRGWWDTAEHGQDRRDLQGKTGRNHNRRRGTQETRRTQNKTRLWQFGLNILNKGNCLDLTRLCRRAVASCRRAVCSNHCSTGEVLQSVFLLGLKNTN